MKPLPTFHRIFSAALCATAILLAGLPATRAAEPKLELKDNDVWVMAGDSITAQRLHTNYIEAFYRVRHPELHLHFRNSGISGNTAGAVLSRFDDDVAVFKPTIVSVELGMNDANSGKPPDAYIKGMKELIARIRALPAQPVLISSSPVDDGSLPGDWKSARCENIDAYTNALKKLAEEENVVVVDQYHPLLELWGQNRRKGAEAAAKNGATPTTPAAPGPDGKLPAAQPVPMPALIPLGGDSIHVGPVGQYTMAATILAGLKIGGESQRSDDRCHGPGRRGETLQDHRGRGRLRQAELHALGRSRSLASAAEHRARARPGARRAEAFPLPAARDGPARG